MGFLTRVRRRRRARLDDALYRKAVLQAIRDGHIHMLDILAATHIPAARLPQIIAALEQDGVITREPRAHPPTYSVT